MLVNVELSAGNINRNARIFSVSARILRGTDSQLVHDKKIR